MRRNNALLAQEARALVCCISFYRIDSGCDVNNDVAPFGVEEKASRLSSDTALCAVIIRLFNAAANSLEKLSWVWV